MDSFNSFGLDRRAHTRCPVTIDGKIYFEPTGAPVTIVNVSETGIGFEISKSIFHRARFKPTDLICICFADKYNWANEEYGDVISVQMEVIQIRETNKGFYVGGRIKDRGDRKDYYEKFVKERKAAHFLTITGFNRVINGRGA